MAVKKYAKRPATVEAIQLAKGNKDEVLAWLKGGYLSDEEDSKDPESITVHVKGMTGGFSVKNGDYILKGENEGDYYPCEKEIFEKSFMEVL